MANYPLNVRSQRRAKDYRSDEDIRIEIIITGSTWRGSSYVVVEGSWYIDRGTRAKQRQFRYTAMIARKLN